MRHTICIYLAIVFFNVPADCLAQSIDSPNQKNVFKTPPKAVRESCGRYSITLNSGQTFKKVKACWSLPKFDRVRIEDKGNVLSVSESEIKNLEYKPGFWAEFKDRASFAIVIIPMLLYYTIKCGSPMCAMKG